MIRAIQTRLEFKILLLLIAVLLVGFGTYAILTIQQQSESLLQQHRLRLTEVSETIMAGIRNVMLTGKAPLTLEFVNDARQNLPYGLTIYDRFGREVFFREGEGIVYNVDDPLLHEALNTRSMKSTRIKEAGLEIYTRYEPLQNYPECWRCHERGEPLRGALQLAVKPGAIRTASPDEATREMAGVIGEFVATAFRTIMLGGQGEQMDTLTAKAKNIPAVRRVQVYSRLGYLAFGPEKEDLSEEEILAILKDNNKDYRFKQMGNMLRLFLPLVNQDRCQICHGPKFPMRGVMVIDFYADSLKQLLRDPSTMFTTALQWTTFEGFRSIMLVGRANSVRYYMDELRSLPVTQTLRVFDQKANECFLNPKPRVRPQVADVRDTKRPMEFTEMENGEEHLVRLSPLPNEVRCHSCHGKNHDVRAVVEVTASMKDIQDAIAANKIRSAGIGLLTMLGVWLVIRIFMKTVVVKPVQVIGAVAQRVGEGDFTAHASVTSRDEIGSLALRINEMIQGLRERFHLEKFVSQQTVDAVRKADHLGVRLGGERRIATVLFSDIRGFTAYAEKVDPERVVTMLNACLAKQSAIVKKHGGDIDKFVGDELVAVFEGREMIERAMRAAIEIQGNIGQLPGEVESGVIKVGIGINTGEMVMGAMGSPERMDYTVIGDNVNLGARLCSSAKAGQILVSGSTAGLISGNPEFHLKRLDPLTVKGKEKPIEVYEVQGNDR